MSDLTEEDKRIVGYLRESVSAGERYFRAKNIADAIGLSAKQVGARLPQLAEKSDDVDIEKWGRARSTTWRVARSWRLGPAVEPRIFLIPAANVRV